MSRIVFFSIPAYGHTNPTVEVVRQLVRRGTGGTGGATTPLRNSR